MRFTTAIFDLDGTLLNTLEDLRDAVNYALTRQSYPTRTIDEVRSFIGNGVEMLIRRAVPGHVTEEKTAETLSVFRAYYRSHTRIKTKPYDEIPETMEILYRRGISMAVVSNKSHQETAALVREIFGSRISHVLGSMPDLPKKPAPDGLLRILREMNVPPENAVYIGDSEVDVSTAHNAGLYCIGVSWGYRGKILLEDAGADAIVETPMDLLDFF